MPGVVDGGLAATGTEAGHGLGGSALGVGAAMMRVFFARQAAMWPSGRRYDLAGVAHQVEGAEVVEIGTRFGKVEVCQPVGRPVGRPRARRDLPMARAVALPGGFTLPLVTLVAKFCALMAFLPTRQTLR